uniref:Uncharacterized protein n=1 Tax=Chenopodium quinoa TaxID=63459 RepID=A0A803LUQ3_CHEQI
MWWNSIGKYHRLADPKKPTSTFSLSLGKQVIDETYPLGKSLTNKHLVELATKSGQQVDAVNIILTASDVAVEGFCRSRCGTHGSSYISKTGTVTNPYGNGYFQDPKEAPLEAASACPGVYGKGAYPGYAGSLLVNPTTGASYNANGVNKKQFLLPALYDPSTSSCSTLV